MPTGAETLSVARARVNWTLSLFVPARHGGGASFEPQTDVRFLTPVSNLGTLGTLPTSMCSWLAAREMQQNQLPSTQARPGRPQAPRDLLVARLARDHRFPCGSHQFPR